MPVISPPPRQKFWLALVKPMAIGLVLAGLITFLILRFGESPIEKAERLYQKRELTDLRNISHKRLQSGESNPLFYSYYAVAEFSTNTQAKLGSLLGHIRAVDARPIFRREALVRIWQVAQNQSRSSEVLIETLKLENPPGEEMKSLIASIIESDAELIGAADIFVDLGRLFPKKIRQVSARELQFRTAPSTEGQVIRRLADGEDLLIRKKGAAATVSGRAGAWVFAADSSMQSGWVFDAYLNK